MIGQMSIFDYMTEQFDPLRAVAKRASPYWTTSRPKLMDLYGTVDDIKWTAAVKQEYCPYGYAGYYGGGDGPNTLRGYTLKMSKVEIEYLDEIGKMQRITKRWSDFAREIAELIRKGEYERPD